VTTNSLADFVADRSSGKDRWVTVAIGMGMTGVSVCLIGIISRADVLSVFARPDEDIHREAAQEAIAESFVEDSRLFGVTVRDGIVTVTGPHKATRQATI
jgi:hypothetical protein